MVIASDGVRQIHLNYLRLDRPKCEDIPKFSDLLGEGELPSRGLAAHVDDGVHTSKDLL